MQWQATVLAGEARAAISPHLKHSQRFLTLHLHELHELHLLPGDTTSFSLRIMSSREQVRHWRASTQPASWVEWGHV